MQNVVLSSFAVDVSVAIDTKWHEKHVLIFYPVSCQHGIIY
jgi:hypothetical protein